MDLFVDIQKGRLNTSKLVKKPVMIRGKDGKVFTRMQWVDPKTGQVVDKKGKSKKENAGGSRALHHLHHTPLTSAQQKEQERIFSPENRQRYSCLPEEDVHEILTDFLADDTNLAMQFSKLTGMENPEEEPGYRVVMHMARHLMRFP